MTGRTNAGKRGDLRGADHMKLMELFKRYLPIAVVFVIGASLSLLAQKNIASKVRQQQMTTFTTLTSTFTAKLQGEKNRHIAILNTLETLLSNISTTSQPRLLNELSEQIMNDIPAIEQVLIIQAEENSTNNTISLRAVDLPDIPYQVLYSYTDPISIPNNETKRVYDYRPLFLTEDQRPTYIVLAIDVDSAFASVLDKTAPDWLDIFVYRVSETGKHLPFYRYPPSSSGISNTSMPESPHNINTTYSVFDENALTTDRSRLSVLYTPREDSFFALSEIADWSALLAGMLLTLIAGFYFHTLLKRHQVINRLVETRTQELSETAKTLSEESRQRNELVTQLSASEARLRGLIHSIDGMFWEKDLIQNRFTFVSDQVTDIFGFSVDDVMDDPDLLSSNLLPDSRKKYKQALQQAKGNQGVKQIELQSLHKDGHQIWIRLIYTLSFENGTPAKLRGVTMDVTRFKRMGAERAKLHDDLVRSQEELTSLVNSIDGVLWEFDKSANRYTYVSAQVAHILGCDKKDVLQNSNYIYDRIVEEDKNRVRQEVLEILERDAKSHPVEFRMINDQGKAIDIRSIYTPIVENGRVTKFRGVMLDVTKEKKMQEEHDFLSIQLKQAQKLEAIGQLAAGVAHEINTPTQFVGDNIHYLQGAFSELKELCQLYNQLIDETTQGNDTLHCIDKIRNFEKEIDLEFLFDDIPASIGQSLDGTNRIRDIVKAMKEFSHPGSTSKEKIDLNHAIESTITVARNEWKYVAEIETQFDKNLPMVEVLPGEFNQVILNILVNAAHAITEKSESDSQQMGKIRIRTEQQGRFAHISISDTGKGIPEQMREKIFDPFYTTKEVGKGTGQGLAIAFSVIVEKHQGQISFESEAGVGTTFHIKIPIESADNKEHEKIESGATETVAQTAS